MPEEIRLNLKHTNSEPFQQRWQNETKNTCS